jgi:hypothetical protein
VKTIVEASVKVKLACVYNSTMTYSGHLHTDYEHAQKFSLVSGAIIIIIIIITIYVHLKNLNALT